MQPLLTLIPSFLLMTISLVSYAKVKVAIKPRHPTSIGNILVVQPFLKYCPRRSSYFSSLRWCAQSIFPSKETVNSTSWTFFELTDQITRSAHWAVNVISAGKEKWWWHSKIYCDATNPYNCHWFVLLTHTHTHTHIYIYIYIYIYICVCVCVRVRMGNRLCLLSALISCETDVVCCVGDPNHS